MDAIPTTFKDLTQSREWLRDRGIFQTVVHLKILGAKIRESENKPTF